MANVSRVNICYQYKASVTLKLCSVNDLICVFLLYKIMK